MIQSGARRKHAHTCRYDIRILPALRSDGRTRPRPVRAQLSDRATGETYHVEVGGLFWSPTPDIAITSESLPGIPGSRIDFVSDLGIEQTRFRQLKLVLRPATKHKFRFEYTPITYEAVGSLTADIVFNGIRFPVTFPVDDEAEVEGVPIRLRVGLRLPRPRVRRRAARGEIHGGRSDADERPRHGVRPGRGRRFRPSASSAASMSSRTSRSPASSAASGCRRGSTRTTARSTTTSISTARSISPTTSAPRSDTDRSMVFYKVKGDEGELSSRGSTSAAWPGSDERSGLDSRTLIPHASRKPAFASRLLSESTARRAEAGSRSMPRRSTSVAPRSDVERHLDAPFFARAERHLLPPAPGLNPTRDCRPARCG